VAVSIRRAEAPYESPPGDRLGREGVPCRTDAAGE